MKIRQLISAIAILCVGLFASPALLAGVRPEPDPFGMISRRSLDRFTLLLHFDKDQSEAAAVLYDGYTAAYRAAVHDYTDECRRIREKDAPRSDELAQHLGAAYKSRNERQGALEQSFFSDLRAVAANDQLESWPAVERARRRERLLPGVISGENVDLVLLIDTLRMPPSEVSLLTETLSAYELDLDRALLDKKRTLKQDDPFNVNNEFSIPRIVRRSEHIRENGLAIRDLNDRFARQIEGAIPDDRRAAFRSAYRAAGFPGVYAQDAGSRLLAGALNLPNLDLAQRDSIKSLATEFERDLAAANLTLEDATRTQETERKSVTMPIESGGSIQVLLGAMDENPVLQARKAKQNLARQFRDKLARILPPEQFANLPELKSSEPTETMAMDSTGVMIHRD